MDPPHITEFAAERHFSKPRELNESSHDAAYRSPLQPQPRQSAFILPLRSADPIADDVLPPPDQKRHDKGRLTSVRFKGRLHAKPSQDAPRVSESSRPKRVPFGLLFWALPSDVQIQIILSLPLADVLNLRLVSTSWHALITLHETRIARHHLDHHIPGYVQRLYPVTDRVSVSLHYLCGLWHRLHVVAKLSDLVCEWVVTQVFLRTTDAQRQEFTPQRERMRRRLIPHLFTIFHFFEVYRNLHIQYIAEHNGHGLQREPYTLNPIEVQIMAMYQDQILLRAHEVFPLVISSLRSLLRPPSYIGRVGRSLRGYATQNLPDEVIVAILCVGGLRQVVRFWEIKGHTQRRSAIDRWYDTIRKDLVTPVSKSRRGLMQFGRKSSRHMRLAGESLTPNPPSEASVHNQEDLGMVFHSSLAAGMPMEPLGREQLRSLLPDLPILQQIWLTTAEALILDRKVVESTRDIKRHRSLIMELIGNDDKEDVWWYGRGTPESARPPSEAMKESPVEYRQEYTSLEEQEEPSSLFEPSQEPTQLGEQENSSSQLSAMMAICWYALMRTVDPPPRNSKRITYTCGCGDLRYLDVEELLPGGADELQQILRADARVIRQRRPAHGDSLSNLPATPPQVHLTPLGQQHSQVQGQPIQNSQTHCPNERSTPSISSTSRSLMPPIGVAHPKYLILCINTKRGLVTPVHLDVSSITNDQYLFERIKIAYSDVRRGHEWNLATLLPKNVDIPNWVLRVLSITPPKQIQLPNWLAHYLENCRFFIPKKAEFAQFQLMPVHKEIYAGNMVKPEVPGDEEVLVKRTYEYKPIHLKVKIISIPFFHELLRPGEHLGLFWWNRFPKKLDSALAWDENVECLGWGIHITEGWNKPLVIVLALLLMSTFSIFVIVYSILTQDASSGAGIGSFMMAFLTLYCWLRYEGWKSG